MLELLVVSILISIMLGLTIPRVQGMLFNDPLKREGPWVDEPPPPEEYGKLGARIVDDAAAPQLLVELAQAHARQAARRRHHERPGAVAAGVLLLGRNLGEGPSELLVQEHAGGIGEEEVGEEAEGEEKEPPTPTRGRIGGHSSVQCEVKVEGKSRRPASTNRSRPIVRPSATCCGGASAWATR